MLAEFVFRLVYKRPSIFAIPDASPSQPEPVNQISESSITLKYPSLDYLSLLFDQPSYATQNEARSICPPASPRSRKSASWYHRDWSFHPGSPD